MAPALSEGYQESVVAMEEGGAPQGAFLKDSQEMERILSEVDLLRVMEAVENFGGDLLPEEEIPAGTSNGAMERIIAAQARLERRCQFLARRLRMQQARNMGKHAAEEARAVVSKACGGRAPGPLQRLENVTWNPPPGLSTASAALRCQLNQVSHHLDSDATLSSSGAESDDEIVTYNNPIQQPMPLKKRALWKWSHERAWIASRWSWLQCQIHELEHRIRQHSEFLRRSRGGKGAPVAGPPCLPSGYSEPLPGDKEECEETCARVRPLDRGNFRKRRLVQMHNLHTAADKAARPSDVRCICQWPLSGCAVCTGRALPTHPLPPTSTLTRRERLALVDPAFHPILSDLQEVSPSLHYSALMKDPQWQQKSSKGALKSMKSISAKIPPTTQPPPTINNNSTISNNNNNNNNMITSTGKVVVGPFRKKKSKKLRRNRSAVRRRTSLETGVGDELYSGGSSPVPSQWEGQGRHSRAHLRDRDRQRLNSSYDIDNIVIPHSIAANTKLEILQYKEILTPKWRVLEEEGTPNNGIIRKRSMSAVEERDSDVEDLSEAGVVERHERCEALERGKYLNKRKTSRRHNSRTTPTPPHTPMNVDETSMSSETGAQPSSTTGGGANGLIVPPSSNENSNSSTITTPMPSCTVALVPLSAQLHDTVTSTTNSSSNSNSNSVSLAGKRRATEDSVEVVAPYSPRIFPLPDDIYQKMLKAMPENHPLSGAESSGRSETSSTYKQCYPTTIHHTPLSDSDEESPEEDPTDPEWNAMADMEKHHR